MTPMQGVMRALLALGLVLYSNAATQDDGWVDVIVPPQQIYQEDSYICVRVNIPAQASRLLAVQPLAEQEVVHHMLLFGTCHHWRGGTPCMYPTSGCEGVSEQEESWECLSHGICDGNTNYMWGWGRNAPAFSMPDNVSFAVGPGSGINQLVLQVHYLTPRPANDTSGVRMRFSTAPTPMSAGLIAYASVFTIPPRRDEYEVVTHCCYRGMEPLTTFAFRVHTHWLGRTVFLERAWNSSHTQRLMSNSPQLPQGFYPTGTHTIMPGDHITSTCVFNSSQEDRYVAAGPAHSNEMCNLYLMSFSQRPVFMSCYGGDSAARYDQAGGIDVAGSLHLPTSTQWAPPPPATPASVQPSMGQVAGVASGNTPGTAWVLHRGLRTWDADSFSVDNRITYPDLIPAATIYLLDTATGAVLRSLAPDLLSMPHMITPTRDDTLWVTDVGRHQALELNASTGEVLRTLGTLGEPGNGPSHLCKPTHVQVDHEGNVYVADGYCNARVAVFDRHGQHLRDLVLPEGAMAVPHSMVLEECGGTLVVADRESKQLVVFMIASGNVQTQVSTAEWGYPYALTAGPYGTTLAMVWDRDADNTTVLVLDTMFTVVAAWHLPNASAPHDFTATAAAPELTGAAERMLALLVGETRPAGSPSRLLQHVLVPAGGDLTAMEERAAAALASRGAVEDAAEGGADAAAPAPMTMAPAPAPVVVSSPAGPVWSNLTSFGMVGGGGGVVGIVLGGVVAVTVTAVGVTLAWRLRSRHSTRFEALPTNDPDKLG